MTTLKAVKKPKPVKRLASENGHFIGFEASIYRWLQRRQKARQLRSIPAVVVEIVREAYLSESNALSQETSLRKAA